MTELEDAVREALRYDAERLIGDVDLDRLLPNRRSHRSDGVGRTLAAAVVVAIVAATSLWITHRHTETHRIVGPPPAATARAGGLVFTIPQGGRLVQSATSISAMFKPGPWVINQTPKPECGHNRTVGFCRGPYTSLLPGQYAVSFSTGPEIGQFRPTTTIAGLPATERSDNDRGDSHGLCPYGFVVSIETAGHGAHLRTQTNGKLLMVQACFGSDYPDLIQTIKTMITSAHR